MHNHILPGIDDGAKTVDDSITLIKEFSSFGVKNFIASPHIMSGYYPNTPDTINNALLQVKEALHKEGMESVSLAASAEHMIDDNYEHLLETGKVMPLCKEYILVEMSFLQPPINFMSAIIKTANANFFPILAHPERYTFLHRKPKKYQTYKEQGILFQLNALSLGDYYGKSVNKVALKLLDEGHYNFIGTDVHNMNQLKALKDLTISKKTIKSLLPIIYDSIEAFY